jgi:hypothetical protein
MIRKKESKKEKTERKELPDREPIPAEERSLFLWAAFSSFILIFYQTRIESKEQITYKKE